MLVARVLVGETKGGGRLLKIHQGGALAFASPAVSWRLQSIGAQGATPSAGLGGGSAAATRRVLVV